MGLFSYLKNVAQEANDDAHGDRLLRGVQSSFSTIKNLDQDLQFRAIQDFLDIRERMMKDIPNLSREARIEAGRAFQDKAAKNFDYDMSGSHARWLAGAWLECGERRSLKAKQALSLLEKFVDFFSTQDSSSAKDLVKYSSFEEWYLDFKKAAAAQNNKLALDEKNHSIIDFMDKEPLRRAFNDGVSPDEVGRAFASQYDISNFIK